MVWPFVPTKVPVKVVLWPMNIVPEPFGAARFPTPLSIKPLTTLEEVQEMFAVPPLYGSELGETVTLHTGGGGGGGGVLMTTVALHCTDWPTEFQNVAL